MWKRSMFEAMGGPLSAKQICDIIFLESYYMTERMLAVPLRRASLLDEPVLVQGPRGAGKTTLIRREFPGHSYVALDDATERARARSDPRGFLARLRGPTVIDDLHRAPELLAHITGPRPLILASSRRLQLPVETFELYPPTQAERAGRPPLSLEMLGRFAPSAGHASSLPPPPKASGSSWLDRDVRALINVHDLDRFESFLRFVESQTGAIPGQQLIADECGLSHRTVTRWLGVLDACFLTLRLPPSSLDFGRRLIRSPRLHLLESSNLESHAISEIYRNARHTGIIPNLSYWRDSNGFEIPLIIQTDGVPVMPVCIAAEPNPSGVARLHRWMELAGIQQGAIIAQRAGQLRRKGILSYSIAQL